MCMNFRVEDNDTAGEQLPTSRLKLYDSWTIRYRSCQILANQVNDAVGEIFLPLHIFTLMSLAIVGSYLLIRLKTGFLLTFSLIWVNFIMTIWMFVWGMGTLFQKYSEESIQSKIDKCHSFYFRKVLKSCPPIRVNIGSFKKLEKRVIMAIYIGVVDTTITLLIASNKRTYYEN